MERLFTQTSFVFNKQMNKKQIICTKCERYWSTLHWVDDLNVYANVT